MKFVSNCPTVHRRQIPSASFFENTFNELFNDFPVFQTNSRFSRPSVNIAENDTAYLIEIAAPGLSREDFEVKIEKEILTVSAKKEDKKEETGNYTRREFNYFEFERSFMLPDSVDASAIQAQAENGILHITLSKKEEAKPAPARVIEIK